MNNELEELFNIVMTYKIASNNHRPNVSGLKEIRQYGKYIGSNKWCYVGNPIKSQNFGLVRKFKCGNVLLPSNNNTKYPEIYEALQKIIKILDPNFKYTTITINKNVKAQPHRDRFNSGMSLIIGFGDYEGGGLYVEEEIGGYKLHDIKQNFLYFDGVQKTHYTEYFTGERWTAIYY